MSSCAICNGDISFWSRSRLLNNIEICGDCKSKMNKIYSEFSLYSNEFSLHQVNTLFRKESEFEAFKTDLFKINSSFADYSDTALRKIFKAVNEDQLIHGIFGKHFQRGYGTLVATDKRLIFIDAGDYITFVFKESIPLENITSIEFSLSNNVITIIASGKNVEIETDGPQYTDSFCDAVKRFINNSGEADVQEYSASVILDLIERLGKLKQNGILTDEEFLKEKAKLFSKL